MFLFVCLLVVFLMQKELETQLSGQIKEPSKQQPTNSSYQQPMKMYLGRFLKPYFKDKLTGLVRQTCPTTDTGLLLLQLTN